MTTSVKVYLAPAPINQTQFIPGGNQPASGAQLFFYQAGTSTKQATYTTSSGTVANSNPIILDSGGNVSASHEVWFAGGQTYDATLAPSTDTDPPVSPYWTAASLTGLNDPGVTLSEWVASGSTATFVNASTFTITGDVTGVLTSQRRLKTVNTGGTLYSTVTSSVFSASTTTIGIKSDTTGLDAGLSAFSYGILASVNDSLPETNEVNIRRFGVTLDGVTDDTTSWNNCISYLNRYGGKVVVPKGTTKITAPLTTISKQGVCIEGAGMEDTIISYSPSVSGAVFSFSNGASIYNDGCIRRLQFSSANTSVAKTMVKVSDASHFIAEQILSIDGSWTGGSGQGSIGIQWRGRQHLRGRDLWIYADSPISIDLNPNIYLSFDHSSIESSELTVNAAVANPVIAISDGAVLTNSVFEKLALVRGSGGISITNSSQVIAYQAIEIRNVRTEQTVNTSSYSIDLQNNSGGQLQDLVIKGCVLDPNNNGVRLAGAKWPVIESISYAGTGTFLNMSTNVDSAMVINSFRQTGSSITDNSTNFNILGLVVGGSAPVFSVGTVTTGPLRLNGNLTSSTDAAFIFTGQTVTAGASTATLTNSPHAGNPTAWPRLSINGSTLCFPCFATT